MDFIITSLQSWDIEIGSTIKNTALEISKQNRVFYINTPSSIMHWLRTSKRKAPMQVNDNLWIIYSNFPAYQLIICLSDGCLVLSIFAITT